MSPATATTKIGKPPTTPSLGFLQVPSSASLSSPNHHLQRQFRAVTTTTTPTVVQCSVISSTSGLTNGLSTQGFPRSQLAEIQNAVGTHASESNSNTTAGTMPHIIICPPITNVLSRPSLAVAATPQLNPSMVHLKPVVPHSSILQTASATGTPVLQCDPDRFVPVSRTKILFWAPQFVMKSLSQK